MKLKKQIGFWISGIKVLSSSASAGVFNVPHFVVPGDFSIGIEPEVQLSSPITGGVQFRFSYGLSELSNVTGIVGSGGGDRGFRLGGVYNFDFFPDIESQPGIGLAFQGLYVQRTTAPSFEASVFPYLHKSFNTLEGIEALEPFLAFPVGMSLLEGRYEIFGQFSFGALFQHSQYVKSVVEFGVALSNNTNSYISGGVVYYR